MEINDKPIQDMAGVIRSGGDLETACHFAGLSISQVYKWLEIGKTLSDSKPKNKDEAFCIALWNELKKVRAEAVVRNVAYIQKAAANGTWQAAAWWLERAVPEAYSKQTQNSIKENTNKQIEE